MQTYAQLLAEYVTFCDLITSPDKVNTFCLQGGFL